MAQHILIADDDPLMLRLYGAYLEAAGYRISTAINGEKALELVVVDPPDLIIMDVVMPEMGGLVALRQLKAQPTTAAIPVVVITSIQAYQVSAQEAKTLGATTFLTKPFSLPSLLAEVRKVLGEPAQT